MTNKKMTMPLLGVTLCFALVIPHLFGGENKKADATEEEIYSMVFNKNKNGTKTSPHTTENGNEIEFEYSASCYDYSNGFISIPKNNSFKNVTKIGGLKTIEFELLADCGFTVKYGYNPNELIFSRSFSGELSYVYDFSENLPSYFEVTSDTTTMNIVSMKLTFNCVESNISASSIYGTEPIHLEGNLVKYGVYPQSVVNPDSEVAAKLNSLDSSYADDNGYYFFGGKLYYPTTGYTSMQNFVFSDGVTAFTTNTRYWFNVEPIIWQVIDTDGIYDTLWSLKALDANKYDSKSKTFKESNLDSFLNETMYEKAFRDNSYILETTIENSLESAMESSSTYAGSLDASTHKLFAPSRQELCDLSGESTNPTLAASIRQRQSTDFSVAKEVAIPAPESLEKNCPYWTRSPSSSGQKTIWMVDYEGAFQGTTYSYGTVGVAPMMRIYHDAETKWNITHGVIPTYHESTNTVTYGMYPQDIVDDTFASKLDNLDNPETDDNGYVLYEDNLYYKNNSPQPYQSSYTFTNGNRISSYDHCWFKVMPIEWKVLNNDDNTYLLFAMRSLDASKYNNSSTDGTFEGSPIEQFLNGEFYNMAFGYNDSYITETMLDNSEYSTASEPNRNLNTFEDSESKVFLLCSRDLDTTEYGFSSNHSDKDVNRRRVATDYALSRGGFKKTGTDENYVGNTYYWTRSPNWTSKNCNNIIGVTGSLDSCMDRSYTTVGVVPAITINF